MTAASERYRQTYQGIGYGPWELFRATAPYASRLLLFGPPSTGKTRHADHWGLRDGEIVFSITLPEDATSASLIGFQRAPRPRAASRTTRARAGGSSTPRRGGARARSSSRTPTT